MIIPQPVTFQRRILGGIGRCNDPDHPAPWSVQFNKRYRHPYTEALLDMHELFEITSMLAWILHEREEHPEYHERAKARLR